jgi:hypothetical protein
MGVAKLEDFSAVGDGRTDGERWWAEARKIVWPEVEQ